MAQCLEPSVDEMVDDPIVRALMAADGVDPRQLRRLFDRGEPSRAEIQLFRAIASPPLSGHSRS
jgi:hypothetical protein